MHNLKFFTFVALLTTLCCVGTHSEASFPICMVKQTSKNVCSSATKLTGVDWSAQCFGSEVHGVAGCFKTKGTALGSTNKNPGTSTTVDSNKYCWCKIVWPFASSAWVYANASYSTFGNCATSCARDCVGYIKWSSGASFVSALYS